MTWSSTHRILRFAPSTNGFLHIGHAYSALVNFEMARATGGKLLLRIEDIDLERCRPEFEHAVYADLGWLGLSWEQPVRRQSEHFPEYASALARLTAQGLTYPCFCTRGDIIHAVSNIPDWPRDPDGSPLYPGTCRHLSRAQRERRLAAGGSPATRIDMAAALREVGFPLGWREYRSTSVGRDVPASPELWGDAVLARKDIPTSYHLSVVVDDALQDITDVVRGEDLFAATSLHRLLQALLDLPAPSYHHHALLRDAAGHKLSKSLRATPLRALRQDGMTPAAVRSRFAADLALVSLT
jgi:glutamyl-Q tRNA(Asp) synthetase